MKRTISLSVHDLVDPLLRNGDIDDRIYNAETMHLGSLLHSSYQRKQGNEYLSEVFLKADIELEEAIYHLEGRADGIIVGGKEPIIDEIKTTVAPLEEFYLSQKEWHLAQASCYAYMYLLENGGDSTSIWLTYISQLDSELSKRHSFHRSFKELEDYVKELCKRHYEGEKLLLEHKKKRNDSIEGFHFPFEILRPGQKEMASLINKSINASNTIFIEAPTGIGKTISALYPSLKNLGKKIDKVFYLTAKGSGQISAYEAMSKCHSSGFIGRESLLYSKEKMCLKPGANCNPDECPFTKDYYPKCRKIIEEERQMENSFSPEYVRMRALGENICPFELELDLSLLSDVIICDYNYLFDPLVKLDRYFGEDQNPIGYYALIDEAHNLPSRARDMYSSSISLRLIDKALDALEPKKLYRSERTLLKKMKKSISSFEIGEEGILPFDELPDSIRSLFDSFIEKRKKRKKGDERPKPGAAYSDLGKEVYRFKSLYDEYSQYLKSYLLKKGDDISVNLRCLDASPLIKMSLDRLRGSSVFSATLSPLSYFMDETVGNEDSPYLRLSSPFPKENFLLMVADEVSIKYKDREKTYDEVASYLEAFVKGKVGNYFLYFPSYEYLLQIKGRLDFPDAEVYIQERDMSEDSKKEFLSKFTPNPTKNRVGLLVLGGAFSEGVDLIEDRLIGVAVVGIGLPQINKETDLMKEQYAKEGKDGFLYAYSNPGLNKVMQAVGRLIRSEKDVGAALLIDDRYARKASLETLRAINPNYINVSSPQEVRQEIQRFYEK